MGQQFLAHWRVWLVIGVLAAVATDLLDTTDGGRRFVADTLVAIMVVALVFYISGVVQRRRAEANLRIERSRRGHNPFT